jgi:hypothetical protein
MLARNRRPGMRLCAHPGTLQTEASFAIADTAQAPFRNDALGDPLIVLPVV